MAGIFKAYDIRGIYPTQLNEEMAFKIGTAFSNLLQKEKEGTTKIVVASDARVSSPLLKEKLAKGIIGTNVIIIDIGLATTPMMYYAVATTEADGGVMITASHNPKQYNGFKLVRKGAVPISYDTGINKIEKMVSEMPKISEHPIHTKYIEYVRSRAKLSNGKKLKVVVDTANGMAGLTFDKIFGDMIDAVPMFFEIDCTFPNHPADPLHFENLKQLQKKVVETGADLGLAFDGDADRVFFVDETGGIVMSDYIATLLSGEIAKKEGEVVLTDIRASRVFSESVEENGGKPVVTRVGHSYIKQKMRELDAVFAGEVSGHYYFKDNYFCDSGVIAAMHILNLLSRTGVKLSNLVLPLKRYIKSEEINFVVDDAGAKMEALKEKYSDGKLSTIDGIRVDYPDWWFNVRSSNTEPKLRLNMEAKTQNVFDEKLKELKEFLSS